MLFNLSLLPPIGPIRIIIMSEPTLPPASEWDTSSFNFMEIFKQYPHLAATFLQQAWDQQHPALHSIVASILGLLNKHIARDERGEALLALLTGNLTQTVLDIAIEEKLYDVDLASFTDEDNVMVIDTSVAIFRILLLCTSMSVLNLKADEKQQHLQPIIAIIHGKVPSFIDMLWKHRKLIKDPNGDKMKSIGHKKFCKTVGQGSDQLTISGVLLEMALVLIDVHLFRPVLPDPDAIGPSYWPPPVSSFYFPLLLYIFAYERISSDEANDDHIDWLFGTLTHLIYLRITRTEEEEKLITCRAMVLQSISTDESLDLVDPKLLHAKLASYIYSGKLRFATDILYHTGTMIRYMSQASPELRKSVPQRNNEGNLEPSLFLGFVALCQRFICTSKPSIVRECQGLSMVLSYFEELYESDRITQTMYRIEFVENFVGLKLIPICCRIFLNYREFENPTTQLKIFIRYFNSILDWTGCSGSPLKAGTTAIPLAIVKRQIEQHYDEVLDSFTSGPNVNKAAVKFWRGIGEKFKIKPGGVRDDPCLPIEEAGCEWKGCLCSGGQSLHSMQMCSGCKMVAYCNVNCQKKDWKFHKKSCQKLP
ncbi:MYND-type zinc finger protein samB [Abortiporus biennis]